MSRKTGRHKGLKVGIIGCGNISDTYFRLANIFRSFDITACADLDRVAAQRSARKYRVRELSVTGLLGDPEIDIVLNLTIPAAHFAVSDAILDAGKHLYTEKPLALSVGDGRKLIAKAQRKNLRIGSAPDTFLGGVHQLARKWIDSGRLGRVTSGTAFVMSHGMEHWHPNPDFFFKPGAGPVMDIGPYYVANLVQLLGPAKRVFAMASTPSRRRMITSRPRRGETIAVETPTTLHALIEFSSGATIAFVASWDVWHHAHNHLELYGEEGSIILPDPNFFGGTLAATRRDKPAKGFARFDHPFSQANERHGDRMLANYRGVGLADMAAAIMADRPHRCDGVFALHCLEIMQAVLKSGETGRAVPLKTSCIRPDTLSASQARRLMTTQPRELAGS